MNNFARITLAVLVLFLVPAITAAQEEQHAPPAEVEVVPDGCKAIIFARASMTTGGNLLFPTVPCWRVYPAFGVSFNPSTDYYEVLAGVATDVVLSERASLGLYVTYAHAKDAEYIEWFAGPSFQITNSCKFAAFIVGYAPLESAGVWQHGVDHARVACDLGTLSVGPVYDNL